jgi:prophage regulatory protein
MLQNTQHALLRRPEVERITALSRSRIYALMDRGDFPRPVSLGSSVAWVAAEVQDWINTQITAPRVPGRAPRKSSGEVA